MKSPIPSRRANPGARRVRAVGWIHLTGLALLTSVVLGLFALTPASAAPAPAAPAAPAPASPTFCFATAETACVGGTLRLSASETVGGVDITITAPDGTEETVTTADTGAFNLPVEEEGDYGVVIDEETLPDGVAPTESELTVPVVLGENAIANFQFEREATGADGFSWDQFAQQAASGIRLGLLLAMASIGLSLIYGTTGLSNLAHAELVTMGGMVAFFFSGAAGLGLPLTLGILLTTLVCAAYGWAQDRVLWQPLRRRGLGIIQMMIVTIGLSLAMQYTFQYFVGAGQVRITTSSPETVDIGPVTLTQFSFVAMGISIVVVAGVGYMLLRTRIGRATRAVADNPSLAAASGIDVDKVIRLVWTLAAGLAGLSGVLYALVTNGVKWDTGLQILLLLFAAVTLGGLGTAFGAVVGSMVIGLVVELTNIWLPGDFKYATALLILILILLVRPQGLLGRAERVG